MDQAIAKQESSVLQQGSLACGHVTAVKQLGLILVLLPLLALIAGVFLWMQAPLTGSCTAVFPTRMRDRS
jgi:hypothetical protein